MANQLGIFLFNIVCKFQISFTANQLRIDRIAHIMENTLRDTFYTIDQGCIIYDSKAVFFKY